MNPALLQAPYSVDYSLNTDNKYSEPERTFASSEYSFTIPKISDGLRHNPLGQTLSAPNNNGLDFNTPPSIHEQSYHHPTIHLLSPPSSIEDSHTSSPQPAPASYSFPSSSTFTTSNASSTDHFHTSIPNFSHSPWNMQMMTDTRNKQPQLLQPTISPQIGYNGLNGTASLLFNTPRGPMEPTYPPTYHPGRSYSSHESQAIPFRPPRTASFPPPLFSPFPLSGPYQMAPQIAGRPEGPPFEETKVIHPLVTSRNLTLNPDILASIPKGFFQVEGKWTCYRRNYFTVACSFSFKSGIPDGPVYLQRHPSQLEHVQQYAVSISARTASGSSSQDSESRQLVQHTPKRDKATETVPTRHLVAPAPPPSHQTNGYLQSGQSYHGTQHVTPGIISNYETYPGQTPLSAPTSYTFERIQFQKATANNGKRRAQQQYFQVIVELSVNTARPGQNENWTTVATKQSYPMVVRGRSPGHYKDNVRRDGQTHMDPDRGNGPGGDRGSINLPMPPFMGNSHSSNMDWAPSHQHSHHYGSSYTRYSHVSSNSPISPSSSTTLTESPTEGSLQFADAMYSRRGIDPAYDRPVLSPILNNTRDIPKSMEYSRRYNQKGHFEDAEADCTREYYNTAPCPDDSFSPHSFELSSASHIKPLCVS